MTEKFKVYFPGTEYAPISIPANRNLSEYLTLKNSPVLFGCRTGICGTCLVEVSGEIPRPDAVELETLSILTVSTTNPRLACQLQLTTDIEISKIHKNGRDRL